MDNENDRDKDGSLDKSSDETIRDTKIGDKSDLQHTSQNGLRPTICTNNLNTDQQPMIWDKNSTVEDDMQTI